MLYVAIDNIMKSYDLGQNVFVDLLYSDPVPVFYYEVFVSRSTVPFWPRHYKAIEEIAKALDVPVFNDFYDYKLVITRLVNKNKFYTGAIVRLVFFPFQNRLKVIAIPKKVNYLHFDSIGQLVVIKRIGKRLKKYVERGNFEFLRQFDIHNYIYNKAGVNQYAFIFNHHDQVLETTLGSILLFEGKTIVSPTFKTGAFYNALQLEVLSYLKREGYQLLDMPIDYERFENADEVWIVKENRGIYYKVGIEFYRYHFTEKHRKIIDEINKTAFINY